MQSRLDPPGLTPRRPVTDAGIVPDADALGALLQRFWHPLVAYASRLLGDSAAAEDVVQHAFVRLWERGHAVPAGDAVRPFLYRVVRNLAANEWRRQQTQRSWLDDECPLPSPVVVPDRAVEEDELAAALAAAVERLPGRRREVFVLSRYHSLTNAQIAEVLSIAPQTVANQLVSALRELRVMLGPHLDERPAPQRPSAERPFPPLKIVRSEDLAAG
ncbi:MAG: RNA polymerase sigma factor [Gemmatimonadaceae bacterium]